MTWIKASGWQVKEQSPERVTGPIELCVFLKRPKRRRDLDNTLKAIQDLLVAHELIEDDDKIMKLSAEWTNNPDIKGTLIMYGPV